MYLKIAFDEIKGTARTKLQTLYPIVLSRNEIDLIFDHPVELATPLKTKPELKTTYKFSEPLT